MREPLNPWLPALEVTSSTTEPTLLLPAGAFETENAVHLRRGRQVETAVLTTLVEQTPAFERFEYVPVA